jgi:hypothetical protein
MEIIKVLKLHELNNIKENLTQIGGLGDASLNKELRDLEQMTKMAIKKLNNHFKELINDKNTIRGLNEAMSGGSNEELDIDKEYDFINKNIQKLEKLNKKYLNEEMQELQYQLNYEDNISDDLESLDDDNNYALAENLNYATNAARNKKPSIFTNTLINEQGSVPVPIQSNLLPSLDTSNNYEILYNRYKQDFTTLVNFIKQL